MKFTKKMILIPEDQFNEMRQIKNSDIPSEISTVSSRESNQENETYPPPTTVPTELNCREKDIEWVLIGMPKCLLSKAKALLHYLIQNKSITWNERGEVSINGQSIPHSHISDLIKDCLQEYKTWQPVGVDTFCQALKSTNTPLSLITNPQRRIAVQSGSGESFPSIPPPPGIPQGKQQKRILFPQKPLGTRGGNIFKRGSNSRGSPPNRNFKWLKW